MKTETSVVAGLGSIIAMVLSAVLNHSFLWAIFHLLCGWFYVLYVLIERSHEVVPAFKHMFS